MTLSANDVRVLDAVERAQSEFDGFAPHGAADWTALRRLLAAGLVECVGDGLCQTCPDGAHDTLIYARCSVPSFVLWCGCAGDVP
jgi:hypothetical protein